MKSLHQSHYNLLLVATKKIMCRSTILYVYLSLSYELAITVQTRPHVDKTTPHLAFVPRRIDTIKPLQYDVCIENHPSRVRDRQCKMQKQSSSLFEVDKHVGRGQTAA